MTTRVENRLRDATNPFVAPEVRAPAIIDVVSAILESSYKDITGKNLPPYSDEAFLKAVNRLLKECLPYT